MVFPSIPSYLDPPNWQPLTNRQPGGNDTVEDSDQVLLPPPLGGGGGGSGGGGDGSIRLVSMTDRARLAKIPQPEACLKCPRCESTNTKFCYFNNYNLSQPRHFCKTCRRYWTRGGALRNVPVGGGCRRNKRTKSRNRSKSPAAGERQLLAGSTNSTAAISLSTPSHLPFLSSLHNFSNYGLNLGIIPPPAPPSSGGGGSGTATGGGPDVHEFQADHWRLQQPQQFPLLATDQQPNLLYTFEPPEGASTRYNLNGFSRLEIENDVGMTTAAKVEESKGMNLGKNFQFWVGGNGGGDINAWGGGSGSGDLHGFSSSSASHLLRQ